MNKPKAKIKPMVKKAKENLDEFEYPVFKHELDKEDIGKPYYLFRDDNALEIMQNFIMWFCFILFATILEEVLR